MRQYLELVKRIVATGEHTQNRTGVETISLFGAMMQFDLRDGFPLLTTKKVLWDTVVNELLWFIRGGHNINDVDAPKKIWDAWASYDGDLGRIYGVQWRDYKGYEESNAFPETFEICAFDQLQLAIARIKKYPESRRNLVSAWNVAELEQGKINFPPCHVLFQLRVAGHGRRLDMAMYQRSCDMALGVPFNIASYALLLSLIANECGLTPGIFTHFLADAHVYVTHLENLAVQLTRVPYALPGLRLSPGKPVVDITKADIHLLEYQHHPFLTFEVAV